MSDIEKTLRCECGCTILQLDYWKWDDSEDFWVDFYTQSGKNFFKHRVKTAWNVLWGKNHYLDTVALTRSQMEQVQDFCNQVLGPDLVPTVIPESFGPED